jgi:hypothetical protein
MAKPSGGFPASNICFPDINPEKDIKYWMKKKRKMNTSFG